MKHVLLVRLSSVAYLLVTWPIATAHFFEQSARASTDLFIKGPAKAWGQTGLNIKTSWSEKKNGIPPEQNSLTRPDDDEDWDHEDTGESRETSGPHTWTISLHHKNQDLRVISAQAPHFFWTACDLWSINAEGQTTWTDFQPARSPVNRSSLEGQSAGFASVAMRSMNTLALSSNTRSQKTEIKWQRSSRSNLWSELLRLLRSR